MSSRTPPRPPATNGHGNPPPALSVDPCAPFADGEAVGWCEGGSSPVEETVGLTDGVPVTVCLVKAGAVAPLPGVGSKATQPAPLM